MRCVLLFSLLRTALIAGTLAATFLGPAAPATAGRLADGLPAGKANAVPGSLLGIVVPVTNPQGQSNAGAGTPGPIAPGPATPGPTTPGPGRTPAFGTPEVVFVAGIWRIIRSRGEFYLWTNNGDTAIQVTIESNGWWGLRRGALESIVWSSGKTRVDPFYDRPWQRATGATFPTSSANYQGPSRWGTTYLDISNDQIRITLTDGGQIQLDTRTPRVTFLTSFGRSVNF
jgi:hypothetical protein